MAGKNVVDIVLDFQSKGSSYVKSIIKDIAKITSSMKEAEKASSGMSDSMASDAKKIKSSLSSTDASVEKLASSIEQMTLEMKQYRTSATAVNNTNNKVSDSFSKLGGAIALAFGGAAVAGNISQTNEDILLLSNRAKLLEMQMSELAAMQKVAFNNGNVAEFEEGLKNLSQRIYDLKKNGGGEGMEVFQQLKLDLDAIYAMPIEEQFYAIADAMADAGYSVQDMYGAFDQLGSDQLGDLAHLLKNGSAEMRKLVEETMMLDSALSEVEYKKLEILAKESKKLSQSMDDTSKKLTSEMSPAIIGVTGGFDELLKKVNENKGAMHGIFKAGLMAGSVFTQLSDKIGASFTVIVSSLHIAFLELKVWMNETSISLHETYNSFFDSLYEKIWYLKKSTLDMFSTFSDSAKKASEEMGFMYQSDGVSLQVKLDKKQLEEDRAQLETIRKINSDAGAEVLTPFDITTVVKNYEKQIETYDRLAKSVADNEKAQAKLNKTKSGTKNNSLEILEAEVAAEELVLEAKLKANKAKIDADLDTEKERYEIAKFNAEKRIKLEELSAEEALSLKLDADKEYADNAAKLLQQKLDLEIELEKKKIANLRKLQDKAASDTEKATYRGEIDSAQVGLNSLVKERNAITSETLQLSELDKARLEAAVALEKHRTAQKKAQKGQSEESKKLLKEETKELERQKEIRDRMQDVYSDYLVATGREAESALDAIDNKYEWLLKNLEQGSKDLELVNKLIDIEKAEAQIDELNRKLQDISYSYDNGDIGKDEYENQYMGVLGEMDDIAQASNSVSLINDVAKATRDAANAFDKLYQVGEKVGSSLSSSFAGAFSSIISGSKSAEESFRDMILDMTQQIINMMINQMVQNFLSSMMSSAGGSGGVIGGIASGIAGASAFSAGDSVSGTSARTMSSYSSPSTYDYSGFSSGLSNSISGISSQFSSASSGVSSVDVLAALSRDGKSLEGEKRQQSQSSAAGSISIVNALDSESIANAVDTPAGHKVIENKVRAMRNEIKSF
ncbi:hypothetical protein ACEV92_13950 [Vibrio parahaemolyticus]|nr:hypothetical protein [Vibrio parahaemolyticus]